MNSYESSNEFSSDNVSLTIGKKNFPDSPGILYKHFSCEEPNYE